MKATRMLSALLVVTFAVSAAAEAETEPPLPIDPGAIAIEFAGAVAGGAICASGLGYLFRPVIDTSGSEWQAFGGTVISGALGYPLFCALGAWGGGRMSGQRGKFSSALVGALAATPLALSLAWTGVVIEHSPKVTLKSSPFYALAALVPAAGAVYAYSRSIPHADGSAESRFLPPVLTVGPVRLPDGTIAARLDCRLINARF